MSSRRLGHVEQAVLTRIGETMLAGMRSKLLWFRVRKFALGVLIALSTPVLAFQHSSESGRAKIHTELSSADWKLRRTGFYRLLQPLNQVRVVERG